MTENALMLDAILIPAGTVITDKGDSPIVAIEPATSPVLLLTLGIDEAPEQQCFDLWLLGSADGVTWGTKPLVTPPQRFYPGEYPTLINLSTDTDKETKFLRAHWEVSRWGRGELKPRFVCGLTLRAVPQELLREAQSLR
jgi:hypothetical protein